MQSFDWTVDRQFEVDGASQNGDNLVYAQVGEAGHTVQGDNPRALAQVLSDFLGKAHPEGIKQT